MQQLAAGTGRLLIDSDGEDLAEEAETHTERHARMLQLAAAKEPGIEPADKVGMEGRSVCSQSGAMFVSRNTQTPSEWCLKYLAGAILKLGIESQHSVHTNP